MVRGQARDGNGQGAQHGTTQHFTDTVLMRAWLIDKRHAECAKCRNQPSSVPAEYPTQNGHWQQGARRASDPAVEVVAVDKTL